jgi:hypothetical protein
MLSEYDVIMVLSWFHVSLLSFYHVIMFMLSCSCYYVSAYFFLSSCRRVNILEYHLNMIYSFLRLLSTQIFISVFLLTQICAGLCDRCDAPFPHLNEMPRFHYVRSSSFIFSARLINPYTANTWSEASRDRLLVQNVDSLKV